MTPICKQCGAPVLQKAGAINRALKHGKPLYCDRVCAGLSRRHLVPLSEAERKEAKRMYDAKRRSDLGDDIRAQKRAFYHATKHDRKELYAAQRKARAHLHAEYIRRPEYRAWKANYDRAYCARKDFGEFAEAALLLRQIDSEIEGRASNYEIRLQNGTLNKALSRRRAL